MTATATPAGLLDNGLVEGQYKLLVAWHLGSTVVIALDVTSIGTT